MTPLVKRWGGKNYVYYGSMIRDLWIPIFKYLLIQSNESHHHHFWVHNLNGQGNHGFRDNP